MTMRANNEGCRALGVWVANALDRAERSTDHVERAEAAGFHRADDADRQGAVHGSRLRIGEPRLQTYGGHGYIVDNGMEQLVRDARITMIYEGTNGVQALDLVGRKLPANMGRSLRRFFHPVAEFIEAHAASMRRSVRSCKPTPRPSAPAARDRVHRPKIDGRPGGSRRRSQRLFAPVRHRCARLHVGSHGQGCSR
jgi:hypothetical protein